MTYGRPSMTSHLPGVPLPGALDLIPFRESHGPPLMTFYVATIELYHILDCILSDVYHTWRGRSSATPTVKHGALDIIIELEEKLVQYELGLPWFLNWTGRSPSASPQSSLGIDPSRRLVLERQRNVLHARYLHIHSHIPGLHIKTDRQQIPIPPPPPLPPNLHTSMLRGHTHPPPPTSTSAVTLTSRASINPGHAPSIHQTEMRRCLCPSRD